MPEVRPIDANDLMRKICGNECGCEPCECDLDACNCNFYGYVHEQPTIEPEVRHGRWETWGYVFHGIEWKRCSRCGKYADVSYYGLLDGEIKMSTPAICGGCGAKMDGGDTYDDRTDKISGCDGNGRMD